MTNNISNNNLLEFSGDSRSSLYLPSVKTWNEQVRWSPFVKDHTAVPLATLDRDCSAWNAPSGEDQFSLQNIPSIAIPKLRMPSDELATLSPANDHQPLNKAFEVASRTRDMLNKLDGWKSLSLKPFPASSTQTPGSTGYMIKSSSQFTTLDAKSDEAKNILQNIKDMAQILCPAEYGGVSHFRVTHDEGQLTSQPSAILKPYLNVNVSPLSGAKATRDVCPVQNKEVVVADNSMLPLNNPIGSSRINIIGASSSKQHLLATPVQSFPHEDNSGTLMPTKSSVTSLKNENQQNLSQVLESYVGSETAQRTTFTKMKALYEDLLAKLKPNPPPKNSSEYFDRPVKFNANLSDSLYEDFEDSTSIPISGHRRAPLLSYPTNEPFSPAAQRHPTAEIAKMQNNFSNSSKEKDRDEWERDTYEFLMKLTGAPRPGRDEHPPAIRGRLPGAGPGVKRQREDGKDYRKSDARVSSPPASDVYRRERKSISKPSSTSSDRKETKRLRSPSHNGFHSPPRNAKFAAASASARSDARPGAAKSLQRSTSSRKEELEFYDGFNNNCNECGLSGLAIGSYLDHLLTPEHAKKMNDLPMMWKKQEFDETLLVKSQNKTSLPIRAGSNLLYPVTAGFFCQPCNKYVPDKESMLRHVITPSHNNECSYYTNLQKTPRDLKVPVPEKKAKVELDERTKVETSRNDAAGDSNRSQQAPIQDTICLEDDDDSDDGGFVINLEAEDEPEMVRAETDSAHGKGEPCVQAPTGNDVTPLEIKEDGELETDEDIPSRTGPSEDPATSADGALPTGEAVRLNESSDAEFELIELDEWTED